MGFCPKCGAERAADAKFCASCGQPFTEEKKQGNTFGAVLALILIVGLAIGGVILLRNGNGPTGVPASANIPPTGLIWFGSSFNTATFELPATSWLSAKVGQPFALVGHLRSKVTSGSVNMRISLDGTTYVNQSLSLSGEGSGDLIGFTYTAPIAGRYQFDLTDLGGAVLASGAIDIREQ